MQDFEIGGPTLEEEPPESEWKELSTMMIPACHTCVRRRSMGLQFTLQEAHSLTAGGAAQPSGAAQTASTEASEGPPGAADSSVHRLILTIHL